MKAFLVLLSALFLVGGGCAGFGVGERVGSVPTELSGQGGEADAKTLPQFALQDYSGNVVSSADFLDEYLVVNVWASWCPFCVKELPEFARVVAEFEGQVSVVAVNRKESRTRAKEFTDNLNLPGSLIFALDPDDSFYRSIGGFSMPETVFVNKGGEIVLHKRGPINETEFRTLVEKLINEEL